MNVLSSEELAPVTPRRLGSSMAFAIPEKNRMGPVVLISRPIAFTFPLSYAYLAGYLREQGEEVRLVFRRGNHHDLVREVMAMEPVLVGAGNLYPELADIADLITVFNKAGRCFPIVIGGQMVSPTPEFALEITGADFGVIGEGEIILYQLVTALRKQENPATVKGLVLRHGEEIINTGLGEVIDDLTQLPAIPYELFPEEEWLSIGRWYAENRAQPHWRFRDRVINVHGGRGCPFVCNFCYHHSKARYRPVADMISEAVAALERFNGTMLYFSDDLALANSARAKKMVAAIRNLPHPIDYSISARIDTLDRLSDELLQDLADTGCRIIGMGIESGSSRVLKLIGKHYTAETVIRGITRLKKVGILPTVSIMVGQYSETREDAEASIQLMRETVRIEPNIEYAFTITTPFPGSHLYDLIFEKGYLKNHREFYDRYFHSGIRSEWNQVVNMSAMSDEEVVAMFGQLVQAYKEEKAKVFGFGFTVLDLLQRVVGKAHRVFRAYVLSRLPQNKGSELFLKLYFHIYDTMQLGLEAINLRMRGLK